MENIHIERWGSSGSRVVMVHGGAQGTASAGHRNFRSQAELAEQGWQLLVPDRPGHGLSADPGRPDDAELDAEWVAELVDDGAHLVGHSFGGLVSLAAAARNPGGVRSLTLIEPALFKIATSESPVRKIVMRMALAMILPGSNVTKAKKVMALLGIPDEFALDEKDHHSLGQALGKLKFPPRSRIEGWVRTVREHSIPLLVLSGSSPAFRATGDVVARKGNGKHQVFECAHHFPQWAGAPFNKVLTEFWTDAERRKST